MRAAPACALCGRPDGLGLGVCPDCGTIASRHDTLFFVRRGALRREPGTLPETLALLLGQRIETDDGRAAAQGRRALVRVPPMAVDRTRQALEERGVPARAVAVGRAWTAMPFHFFVLLAAVPFAGGIAGASVTPFAYVSPFVALALLFAAQHAMARPALPLAAADLLPADVEALLRDALARVAGRPRELLSDLARMARPLMASLRREGDPAALGDSLAELLRAACATAREVHRLESTASTVTTTLDAGAGSMDDRLRLAAGRCRTGAETGTRRLIEAVAAVGDAGSRAAPDTASGSRLAQLTRQLTDDVRHHEDTLRELDSLLAR